jgi:hypothetical protein
MIQQNFENITQSGTTQTIEANITGMNLTSTQFYCSLACLTLVLVVSIVMISRLIQTAILRVNYIRPKTLQKLKEDILKELK